MGKRMKPSRFLFKLYNIISVEPDGSQSIIQTRLGKVMVQMDVDTI